jgi:hypothetical protein
MTNSITVVPATTGFMLARIVAGPAAERVKILPQSNAR